MEIVKVECEGQSTKVELKPCGHCGKLPTAEDAQRAFEHERSTVKRCAICGGKPPAYPKHALYHSVECDGRGGFILCGTGFHDPTWDPAWITTYCTGPSGTVDAAFHLECFLKVAPGATIHKR